MCENTPDILVSQWLDKMQALADILPRIHPREPPWSRMLCTSLPPSSAWMYPPLPTSSTWGHPLLYPSAIPTRPSAVRLKSFQKMCLPRAADHWHMQDLQMVPLYPVSVQTILKAGQMGTKLLLRGNLATMSRLQHSRYQASKLECCVTCSRNHRGSIPQTVLLPLVLLLLLQMRGRLNRMRRNQQRQAWQIWSWS